MTPKPIIRTKAKPPKCGRLARRLAALLSLWIAAELSISSGLTQEPGAVLLKQTDRVLSGVVTRRGEFYDIEIANQSRVSIPAAKVAYVGRNIWDLYEFKRSSVSQWKIGDHYQLTQWCLLNDLLGPATEHYAQVTKQAPEHPRVKQLAIELEKRLLNDSDFRQFLGLGPVKPLPNKVSGSNTAHQVAPVGQASFPVFSTAAEDSRAEAVQATSHSDARSPNSPVSTAGGYDLQVARNPEITRQFAERIQPILINRCSQSACHGGQSSTKLRLIEPYPKAMARITSDNLSSVLQQVAEQPDQLSAIVRYATLSHGIQKVPAIEVTETVLLNELQAWVMLVQNPVVIATGNLPTASPHDSAAGIQPAVHSAQAVPLVALQPGGRPLRAVPHSIPKLADPPADAPVGFPPGLAPPTASEIDALEAQFKRLQSELKSTDPFDPSEFNRKSLQRK